MEEENKDAEVLDLGEEKPEVVPEESTNETSDVVISEPTSEASDVVVTEPTNVTVSPEEEKDKKPDDKKKKKSKKGLLIVLICLVIIGILAACYVIFFAKPEEKTKKTDAKEVKSPYRLSSNGLENFDLYFLQLENEAKNKVYSPLSIKYALEMLSEGAKGNTKKQLDSIIGDYKNKKYINSDHMSFANAMFIRDTFKDVVKDEYTDKLKDKYGAEVILDPFSSPNNINEWVSSKTFKLINNLINDVSQNDFFLINALAIDMNWNNQIHCAIDHKIPCYGGEIYSITYDHEKLDDKDMVAYSAVSHPYAVDDFYRLKFNNQENIKGAEVLADFNKYDIIKEVGEDNIRKTVTEEYKKWLETEEGKSAAAEGYAKTDVTSAVNDYIDEIKTNYGKAAANTDFLLYNDENVKVFAKDLKEYDGTTLQYVGIMPVKDELTAYIDKVKADDLNKIIKSLKPVDISNFKEGVATRIRGSIPFFDFEYELKLLEDLKKLGVKDVFDPKKADLTNMVDSKGASINKAVHKAKIEFSNDGIKAAAATAMGGLGATGGGFEYLYKIPVEEIDISFNKPYMYIIRDKNSGEVWFTGTVYEPIKK